MNIHNGWLSETTLARTSHFNLRSDGAEVSLLVIHNISLPPGKFGRDLVTPFFMGNLDPGDDPFLREIADMRVSAHCFIDRIGTITQYVSFDDRAWHAGESCFQGVTNCNDFSIGIELEGTDDLEYTDAQYERLNALTRLIIQSYPKITLGRIVGHNDIAPGRKTDPGVSFNWGRYRMALSKENT